MKPKFSTLIILTLISALILAPFAFSSAYIPILRENSFDFLQFIQGEVYKQITGYLSLVFVLIEMMLIARKRSRGWKFKISIPGSMQLWRSLHIFAGVGLLGITLVHTFGVNGLNFNAIFLWVFFGVTLSALVGVVAETGVLESPQKYFGWGSVKDNRGLLMSKGSLIRAMRQFWLSSHIFLVSVFIVMLIIHIFLAYYYQ
ncbi:MAG: hypothetical protein Tsb0014_26670 [Pleurocapsa sp.]